MVLRIGNTNKGEVVHLDRQLSEEHRGFYKSVYEKHYGALHRFLRRLSLNEEDAQDIAQDVYLRIVRQQEPHKLEQSPCAYLFTIATNLVRDRIRRNALRKDIQQPYDGEAEVISPLSSPEVHLQRRQGLKALKAAIDELPDKHRNILILHRFNNLTCKEISNDIGISLRSVQRYLSEALAHCQAKLGKVV